MREGVFKWAISKRMKDYLRKGRLNFHLKAKRSLNDCIEHGEKASLTCIYYAGWIKRDGTLKFPTLFLLIEIMR